MRLHKLVGHWVRASVLLHTELAQIELRSPDHILLIGGSLPDGKIDHLARPHQNCELDHDENIWLVLKRNFQLHFMLTNRSVVCRLTCQFGARQSQVLIMRLRIDQFVLSRSAEAQSVPVAELSAD